MQETKEGLTPVDDMILSPTQLGRRWGKHPKSALRLAKDLGIPQMKFNQRVIGLRLSDVLKAEAQAVVH
jgi:hypothetical protein